MHQNYTDLMDRYLKGNLSGSEQQAFEEKLRQDPLLAHEMSLQKDIYVALGETRKATLKYRLNQVSIDHSPWAPWQSFKTAAVVGTLLVVGASTYYYFNADATVAPVADTSATQRIVYPKAYTLNHAPIVVIPKKETADVPATVEEPVAQNRVSVRSSPRHSRDISSTIVRPEVVSEFAEDTPAVNYSDFKAPEKKTLEGTSYQEENIAIEALSDSEYNFHYQFYDGKLYLHGNFYGMPYKIIALNTDDDKKLFLEFDEAYYRIGEHREVVPLVKIEDSALVESLRDLGKVD